MQGSPSPQPVPRPLLLMPSTALRASPGQRKPESQGQLGRARGEGGWGQAAGRKPQVLTHAIRVGGIKEPALGNPSR